MIGLPLPAPLAPGASLHAVLARLAYLTHLWRTTVACICGADEPCTHRCERHSRVLHGYPCGPCGQEWETAHPHTAAAISRLAAGKGSTSSLAQARRQDAALTIRQEPTTP